SPVRESCAARSSATAPSTSWSSTAAFAGRKSQARGRSDSPVRDGGGCHTAWGDLGRTRRNPARSNGRGCAGEGGRGLGPAGDGPRRAGGGRGARAGAVGGQVGHLGRAWQPRAGGPGPPRPDARPGPDHLLAGDDAGARQDVVVHPGVLGGSRGGPAGGPPPPRAPL